MSTALLRPYTVPGTEHDFQLVKGEGSRVFDRFNRRYLDAVSGLWNTSFGLSEKRILERMQDQMERLAFSSLFDSSHTSACILADRLVDLTDGAMDFVYLSTTGTSAVENAISTCLLRHFLKTSRKSGRILAFEDGYHGSSLLARSASGIVRNEIIALDHVNHVFEFIPNPKDEVRSLSALREILSRGRQDIAGFLFEPVLGSAGVIVPSESYAHEISKICQENDVVMIADEVATGFGRCGSFFASFQLGFQPDIITLSKGLTAGFFPLGATLFKRSVLEPLSAAQVQLPFGSTQDGNPIGCAAALATIELLSDQDFVAQSLLSGNALLRGITDIADRNGISEARGMGLMLALDFGPRLDGQDAQHVNRIRKACREEGLLVYAFETGISLFPALNSSSDDIDEMLEILDSVLS